MAVPLDAEALLEQARRETGLADFGGSAFREPLGLLVESLEHEARLTFLGRLVVRDEILTVLENRLHIADTLGRRPEIASEEIRGPLVVAGVGRSGTTILQALLAQDPANRAPLGWEVRYPCHLAAGRPDGVPDAELDGDYSGGGELLEQADAEVRFGWGLIAPELDAMHEMGGSLPQECVLLLAHELRSGYFAACYQVPSYAAWLATADMEPAYAYHRRMLQLLQWQRPAKRWVLRTPGHLGSLDALFAVYPDARVIQTHRDPLQATASLASLLATIVSTRAEPVEPWQLGQQAARAVDHLLAASADFRARSAEHDARFCDVLYRDFLADPIAEIARIYDRLGLVLGAEAEARMRAYLEANPQGRHGRHHYSWEATGLDRAAERRRFAAYQARYGVPSEP